MDTIIFEQQYAALSESLRHRVDAAVDAVVAAKERGKKVVAALGSGPNLHEGVTTLVAELMQKGIIDGVTTSSAVVSHEMAGTLDKVKRVSVRNLGLPEKGWNAFEVFEATVLTDAQLACLAREMELDEPFYRRIMAMPGNTIIKAAGNMAYPVGLRTELLAMEVFELARNSGRPFEEVVGHGADPMTMIGAGARRNLPVLVTVPQLVGGGKVGLAIGDSITITERAGRIARLYAGAEVIIESAIALSQEIHDGPLETYTGHGIWSNWQNEWTYSLNGKKIFRIDLDINLERIWQREHDDRGISNAVIQGLPKTKVVGMPFRMEMSGFARLPASMPIIGDIGLIWPILALRISQRLGVQLDFISCKQDLAEGAMMREWIVENVQMVDRAELFGRCGLAVTGPRKVR